MGAPIWSQPGRHGTLPIRRVDRERPHRSRKEPELFRKGRRRQTAAVSRQSHNASAARELDGSGRAHVRRDGRHGPRAVPVRAGAGEKPQRQNRGRRRGHIHLCRH